MNRRGACPTFSAPMQTGDGLLARLHPAGPIGRDAFTGLCRAAEAHGNGIIEVTQRGSIQIRGLTPETLPGFTADVQALDFDAPEGVVVLAPPLSSRSLVLAAAIRTKLDGIASQVSPKTSVIVDLDDGLSLDALTADICLRAAGPLLHLGVAGEWIGAIAASDALDVVSRLVAVMAAAGREARARNLDLSSVIFAIRRHLIEAPAPRLEGTSEAVGRHGKALGIGLPFGAVVASALLALIDQSGADRIWAAPGRALVFEGAKPGIETQAIDLGFITEPHDPRRRIHACTGAPRCASGLQPVRALAPELGALDGVLHLSGCAKGCAHPAKAPVTLVGGEKGYGIIWDGRAGDPPSLWLSPAEVLTKLPDLLEKRRRAPESPAAVRGRGAGRG